MTAPASGDEARFRAVIAERMGLSFDDEKRDMLADLLRRRMEATGEGQLAGYLARLSARSSGPEEVRALARELTVGETYFLRNGQQFDAFTDILVRRAAAAGPGVPALRVLSAGCASGEEAYSLAIIAREHFGGRAAELLRVRAIDLNRAALHKARAGRYSSWSLRGTSDRVRELHFRTQGRDFVVHDDLRALVTFEERNLVEDEPAFWSPEAFDVVFCRNVLMYFEPEAARAVVARIARSLAPGGHLFMGHAETLRGLSGDFHICNTHETFYYRRRDALGAGPSSPRPALRAEPASPAPDELVEAVEATDSWMETIRLASERIEQLAREPAGARPGSVPVSAPAPSIGRDVVAVTELLRQERFAEALAQLHALPAGALADPEVQLLRAVLLTNVGDPAEAEEVCERLLDRDELNAGAHYLRALCRERAGDVAGATKHDRTAAYLDPTFAMPRLHLGLLAKRARDLAAARGELGRALFLLAREDASRVLLFGGGFTRDALVELCRAELRALGGEGAG